jgi:integrase
VGSSSRSWGGIDRLPSGAYRARIDLAGRRLAKTCPTRALAEAWLEERRIWKATGRKPDPPETLAAARERVLAEMATRGYRPSYLADFRSLSRRVVAAIGPETPVSEVDPRSYATSLRDSPSTRRNLLNALSKLVGGIPRGVRPRISYGKERAESSAIPGGILSNRVLLILLLASDAGLRRAEIAQLRPGDVSRGWIHVRDGKGGRERWVPVLTERLEAALSGPWHGIRSPHSIDTLLRAAGVPVQLHALRHGWVSRLADLGVPPHQLAAWAGHSVAVSMRYYHPATPFGSRSAETPDLAGVRFSRPDP